MIPVMDEDSPYQVPLSTTPPALPQGPAPQIVKVFGILHLVFAGFGFVFGLWGLVSVKFMSMIQTGAPGDPMVVMQRKYMEDLWPVTVMQGIFAIGLAALLTVAGVKLVRSIPNGVMWSNRYAWTSITTKIIALVVTVAYVLPLSNRMMGDVFTQTKGMPAGTANMMTGVMKSMNSIASVATPIVSCIYPLLALYFLSRPAVKVWVGNKR